MNEKDAAGKENKKSITRTDIFARGSIIALLITVPSLVSFFVAWDLSGKLLQSAVIGLVVHFIAMGFSMKISKKLFSYNTRGQDSNRS